MSNQDDPYRNAPKPLQDAVFAAINRFSNTSVLDLGSYLLNIWGQCVPIAETNPPWQEVGEIIAGAFTPRQTPEPINVMQRIDAPRLDESAGWREFEDTILFMVADLRRMRDGALKDQCRYFGVQSPTNYSWYNFDPLTFLECGLAGLSDLGQHTSCQSNWGTFALFLESGAGYE
ncbi:MAG: hypothetical protein AAF351_06850 [Pseudomonadota bacterium]